MLLNYVYEICFEFLDQYFGFRFTVLATTEDASLSFVKLVSLSFPSEGVFVHSSPTYATILHSYEFLGASSQDGDEPLLSIVGTPNCCLSVPSLSNVAYSDSKICLA